MPRVLVSDPIAKEGIYILEKNFDVDVKTGMSKDELISVIGEYDALAIRSETKVTADVLETAKNLKIIGRAGVGVDNIDVAAATNKGILVVNSPSGNTIAAAELTMALMLSLSRNIPQGHNSLHAGEWKRSKFVGNELYRKTLGIFGLGKIGSTVAKRAQSFEMDVIGYDPFISEDYARKLGIELVSFEDLLKRSDYFTLHVPATKETKGSICANQLAMMKHGVRIINVARGGIIDEAALAEAVKSGHVAGIAVDVYEKEPPAADNPLLQLDNAITTPHLGASTEEAQINVSVDVAEQIVEVLNDKPARSAVNMPSLSAETLAAVDPYMHLGERIGSMVSQLSDGGVISIEMLYSGDLSNLETGPITRSILKGFFQPAMMESVNLVNAPIIAEGRGIKTMESKCSSLKNYSNMMTVKIKTDKGETSIDGTLFGKKDIRIIRIDGYKIDVIPEGTMLFAKHIDKPGIIGKVGTLLGNEGINIAGMHVGRAQAGSEALMALNLDDTLTDELLKDVLKIGGIETVRVIHFD